MLTQNLLLQFILGILASLASLYPTGKALQQNPSLKLYRRAKLEWQIIYLPILYGILALIIFYLVNNYFPKYLQNYWMVGLISGLLYATIKAINKEAIEVYHVANIKMFLIDSIFYPVLYGIVFKNLVKYMCS
uniref:Uncharacterized protein n=1 Tax=Mimivirus LCMiAC01 TaxID=2506608 RepID=A0A481Z002_9VIRU|nr:MAG: hypothetical protein LCMiAC01_00610 [Mimivirus LCMiAC01]